MVTKTHYNFWTVDFIFGDAAAIIQNCLIICKLLIHGQINTITPNIVTSWAISLDASFHPCQLYVVVSCVKSTKGLKIFVVIMMVITQKQ